MTDLLHAPAAAVAFALLAWWFGTGAILWLVRRPAAGGRARLAALGALALAAQWGAWRSMQDTSAASAYLGFASVIVLWAWHELAFLGGWVAGPRRMALSPGARGGQRLSQAVGAVLYHELALAGHLLLLALMQAGRPGHVALCTFALLWCMRLSAKLNLYIGVPEVGERYLPAHLAYLGSYFRSRRPGAFFWASVLLATAAWGWLVAQARAGSVALTPGWVLPASLLGLGIVEHLLMAYPLPLQRLWGWAMRPAAGEKRA